MSENTTQTSVSEWANHWKSVAEFQRHRAAQIEKELEFPDHWSYRAEQDRLSERMAWIVLLSTVAAVSFAALAQLIL